MVRKKMREGKVSGKVLKTKVVCVPSPPLIAIVMLMSSHGTQLLSVKNLPEDQMPPNMALSCQNFITGSSNMDKWGSS
jgi:hypothetical protein